MNTTAKQAAEITSFKDTGKTLVHRGQLFHILLVDTPDNDSPYVLKSKRGKYYALTRNRATPTALFGIGLYDGCLNVLPGWFSDKSGELVSTS